MSDQGFFTDANIKKCILYEYLRGLTPKQALLEFEKAKHKETKLTTITQWFARFECEKYDVSFDLDEESPWQSSKEGQCVDEKTFKRAFEKLEVNDKLFSLTDVNAEDLNSDLLKFIENLGEGRTADKVEICLKNSVKPNHVLIGVKYDETKTSVLEIYHCSTGVVVRRGKETKLLEGKGYKYIELAVAACTELLKKKPDGVKLLKLGAEDPEDNDFFEKLYNSLKVLSKEPSDASKVTSSNLVCFGSIIKGLEELEITYDRNPKKQMVNDMKNEFVKYSKDTWKSCTIHCSKNVSGDIVKDIENVNFVEVNSEENHIKITKSENR